MHKKIIILSLLTTNLVVAQNVGINTTGASAHPSAILDVDATPSNNKGFLMPRLTTVQRLAIATPATGLQVYDTDLKGVYVFDVTWDCLNTPAGTVQYFANTTPPRGYLECNGQSVSTTQYPELFTAIGYTYGGAGANFNVPDLRGEFVRGWDNTSGVDAGRVLGSKQIGTIIGYDIEDNGDFGMSTTSSIGPSRAEMGADDYVVSDYSTNLRLVQNGAGTNNHSLPGSNTGYTGYSGITRPRNVALMPCIKF